MDFKYIINPCVNNKKQILRWDPNAIDAQDDKCHVKPQIYLTKFGLGLPNLGIDLSRTPLVFNGT